MRSGRPYKPSGLQGDSVTPFQEEIFLSGVFFPLYKIFVIGGRSVGFENLLKSRGGIGKLTLSLIFTIRSKRQDMGD